MAQPRECAATPARWVEERSRLHQGRLPPRTEGRRRLLQAGRETNHGAPPRLHFPSHEGGLPHCVPANAGEPPARMIPRWVMPPPIIPRHPRGGAAPTMATRTPSAATPGATHTAQPPATTLITRDPPAAALLLSAAAATAMDGGGKAMSSSPPPRRPPAAQRRRR